MKEFLTVAALMALILSAALYGQVGDPAATRVQGSPALYSTTPISATAAVNNQVTLTIPAPAPGLYNYVCTLGFSISQDGTSTAATNSATTSTNFNAFALKTSLPATANEARELYFQFGTPAGGCAKSVSPGTATTFVSPAALTNAAFTWYATYYQAP